MVMSFFLNEFQSVVYLTIAEERVIPLVRVSCKNTMNRLNKLQYYCCSIAMNAFESSKYLLCGFWFIYSRMRGLKCLLVNG